MTAPILIEQPSLGRLGTQLRQPLPVVLAWLKADPIRIGSVALDHRPLQLHQDELI